jgi:hypothetical protein
MAIILNSTKHFLEMFRRNRYRKPNWVEIQIYVFNGGKWEERWRTY